jgi:hypothetical protein
MSFFPSNIQMARGQRTAPKANLLSLSFQDDEWNQGPVFDYQDLVTTSADAVATDKLEIRKDTSCPVPHRCTCGTIRYTDWIEGRMPNSMVSLRFI